jgi:chemotaxis response regulator CheB
MSRRPIRVFLIDDHAIIAAGVDSILAGAPGIVLAGHAKSGRDALAQIDSVKPDVVLLDIGLRDESGIATMRKLHARAPAIRVLDWTAHEAPLYASEMIRAGALYRTALVHATARTAVNGAPGRICYPLVRSEMHELPDFAAPSMSYAPAVVRYFAVNRREPR